MDAGQPDDDTVTSKHSGLDLAPSVERPKRTWRGLLRDLCFYLLIYILVAGLSIGPFFWSWHAAVYADGSKWIARFYQPLVFLCQICPPLRWLINEWVNFWIL